MSEDISWLANLNESVWGWLSALRVSGHPGWVRHCKEGALFEPGIRRGLGTSCLALKIIHMLGLYDRLEVGELADWTQHIQSFQRGWGFTAGFFEDPLTIDPADRGKPLFQYDFVVRRAETRQACATLMMIDSAPRYPVTKIPRTPKQVREFVRELDWTTPWHAGSHVGHLLFFFNMNNKKFDRHGDADKLIPIVMEELEKLHNPETGGWYSQSPSMEQIVNGAMKVLTGYAALGVPFPNPEKLIDTCLTAANDMDGCHNADIVLVLEHCCRITRHRRAEVEDFLLKRLENIRRFYRADGGFSYWVNKAQTNYYTAEISRGLPESDVHGTILFVWGIVMAGEVLGYNQQHGWRLPVT